MPRIAVRGIVKMAGFKAWYALTRDLSNAAKVKMANARIGSGYETGSRRFFALFADGDDDVVVAFHNGIAYYAVVNTTEAGVIWNSLPEAAGLEIYF